MCLWCFVSVCFSYVFLFWIARGCVCCCGCLVFVIVCVCVLFYCVDVFVTICVGLVFFTFLLVYVDLMLICFVWVCGMCLLVVVLCVDFNFV